MKKIKSAIILCLVSMLLLASCTIKREQEQLRTITVNGHGTVSVLPDRATMVFAVITQNWIAQTAVQENSRIMSNVIQALRAAGIRESDITTSGYTVNQQGSWNNGVFTPGRYRADNTVTVITQHIDSASSLIDAAVGAGATSLTSLSFSASDTETALRQARALAVQDAQNAAALFAGASGCAVGNVIELLENTEDSFSNASLTSKTDSTPVSSGYINVTSSITVKYALQ